MMPIGAGAVCGGICQGRGREEALDAPHPSNNYSLSILSHMGAL